MCTGRLALLVFLTTIKSLVALADADHRHDSERFSAVVTLSDLDLKTPAGAREARDRIRKAALRLCRRFSDSRRISDRQTVADCMDQTAHDAASTAGLEIHDRSPAL
jgi:UrcA family protein